MRNTYITAALLSSIAALSGCGSTTTAADYARMDAYAQMNSPGARGAPTPKDMAAMGLFRTPEQLASDRGETSTASTASSNLLANLRFIGK
jgi:hypothetical protein